MIKIRKIDKLMSSNQMLATAFKNGYMKDFFENLLFIKEKTKDVDIVTVFSGTKINKDSKTWIYYTFVFVLSMIFLGFYNINGFSQFYENSVLFIISSFFAYFLALTFSFLYHYNFVKAYFYYDDNYRENLKSIELRIKSEEDVKVCVELFKDNEKTFLENKFSHVNSEVDGFFELKRSGFFEEKKELVGSIVENVKASYASIFVFIEKPMNSLIISNVVSMKTNIAQSIALYYIKKTILNKEKSSMELIDFSVFFINGLTSFIKNNDVFKGFSINKDEFYSEIDNILYQINLNIDDCIKIYGKENVLLLLASIFEFKNALLVSMKDVQELEVDVNGKFEYLEETIKRGWKNEDCCFYRWW